MLGIAPRVLGRRLGLGHYTWAPWTIATQYEHGLLRHQALRKVGDARYKSKVAGDNESGHIQAGENEGIFFIDSEYYESS